MDKTVIGILWYDDTKKKHIVEVITDAAERYLEKFGKLPALVLVNELVVPELGDIGVPVFGKKSISNPHLVWVGGPEDVNKPHDSVVN